jgi:hypothetical protein
VPDHILERLDRARCLGDERERRLVVDHVDHDRLLARLGSSELDDGVHVPETGVIGAGGDAGHGCGRAGALVDVDVETFGFEVALFLRPEHIGVDALIFPIQGEANLGGLLRRRAG